MNTKTVSGYKEGPTGGEGSRPHKIEKVENALSGSCAGAGSEQFHIYQASRRREMDRISKMEKDFVTAEEDKIFAEKLLRNKVECEDKTKRNAEKRKRKKGKQMAAKKKSLPGTKISADDEENDDKDDEMSDQEETEREIKIAAVEVK